MFTFRTEVHWAAARARLWTFEKPFVVAWEMLSCAHLLYTHDKILRGNGTHHVYVTHESIEAQKWTVIENRARVYAKYEPG